MQKIEYNVKLFSNEKILETKKGIFRDALLSNFEQNYFRTASFLISEIIFVEPLKTTRYI